MKEKMIGEKKMKEKSENFKVGQNVVWTTTEGYGVKGKILRIYKTTFGSRVFDKALQIELKHPRLGRKKTTIRAKNCEKC